MTVIDNMIEVISAEEDIQDRIQVGNTLYRVLDGSMTLRIPDQAGNLLYPVSVAFMVTLYGSDQVENFDVTSTEVIREDDTLISTSDVTKCDEGTARVLFPQLKGYSYKVDTNE